MSKIKKTIPQNLANSPRLLAWEILLKVEKNGSYSNLLLREKLNSSTLTTVDKAFVTEIVYGTLARKITLDYFLQPYLAKAKQITTEMRVLLRLSLFQKLYLQKVPEYALVDEAVKIAKFLAGNGAAGFINAILRNILRNGVPKISLIKNSLKRLAVEISLPEDLVQLFAAQFGFNKTRKIGLSLFEIAHPCARIATNQLSMEVAQEILVAEGFKIRPSQLSDVGIVCEKGNLAQSSLFIAGKMTIQDESSQLVAPILQIKPNHLVLDACAAPGGKTTHIASFLDSKQGGKVYAVDLHQQKINLIKENVKRMHLTDVVEVFAADAKKLGEKFPKGFFDRILLDAPCSGLGLMRRKPDLKYTKSLADIKRLQEVQLELLKSLAPLLKKGVILVYSTCTITFAENKAVIKKFLQSNHKFEQCSIFSKNSKNLLVDHNLQITPEQYGTDGFFISCLKST